jgi:hypothetical protein
MKVLQQISLFLLLFSLTIQAQTYSGPADGSVPSGVIISTDNFQRVSVLPEPKERGIRNIYKNTDDQVIIPQRFTTSSETDNYYEDPSTSLNKVMYDTAMAVMLKSFQGLGETGSIPPDPYIAAGPTHVVAVVNSRFVIWDKEGNLVKQIDASNFYRPLYSLASPFDPKVLYDHFAKRWIMVWLHQSDSPQTGFFFVSVSDDSIPTGNWYNWALPSNQNGNTVVDNWGDYQGVGFDDKALYITSNQFSFGSSFQYVKLRIIPKDILYSNTTGILPWKDIWNIRYPSGGPNANVFNIRPSIMHDTDENYYLLHSPNYTSGNDFMALYKISNPLTNPVLSGSIVPVTLTYPAPNANQLGGSTILLEAGGSNMRSEPKFRQGYLWGFIM